MNNQKTNHFTGLKKAVSVALMGTVCITAAFSVAALSKTVTVTDGEKTMTVNTMNPDTDAILKNSGISLGENDKLVRTYSDSNSINISILRAFNVDVKDNNKKITAISENTVADALKAAGMTLSRNDSVSLSAKASEKPLKDTETEIKISRWYTVNLNLRGKKSSEEVPAGTVKNALEYLGIQLDKNDVLNVDQNKKVSDGLNIKIERVEYKNVTKKEKIGYDTETTETDDLLTGQTKVKTKGVDGEREVVYKEKYVNGKKVSSEEISSEVTKEPVTKKVLKGTGKKVDRFSTSSGDITVDETNKTLTDPNGDTVKFTDVLTGSGTAYYSEEEHPLTATGRDARYGVVAVDPDIIPYGSILYIVSNDGEVVYGYAVAGDTGGALWEGTAIVDLYYDTLDECCVFGRRDVTIYVLDGVPESKTYEN